MRQKNICKTYDLNAIKKKKKRKKAGHSNNFQRNLKQLPRVLKSSYSKTFWNIPKKFL